MSDRGSRHADYARCVALCASADPREREEGFAWLLSRVQAIARVVVARNSRRAELDADDIASEIVRKCLPEFERGGVSPFAVDAYLAQAVRRTVIERVRSTQRATLVALCEEDGTAPNRSPRDEGPPTSPLLPAEQAVYRGELEAQVATVFAALKDACRKILTHVFYGEESQKALAEMMGQSHDWVRTNKRRCLDDFRRLWSERYPGRA